jgi:hypothetical protein
MDWEVMSVCYVIQAIMLFWVSDEIVERILDWDIVQLVVLVMLVYAFCYLGAIVIICTALGVPVKYMIIVAIPFFILHIWYALRKKT